MQILYYLIIQEIKAIRPFSKGFLEKGVILASSPYFGHSFSKKNLCYILRTDLISWSDSLYFLKIWAISVSYLFSRVSNVISKLSEKVSHYFETGIGTLKSNKVTRFIANLKLKVQTFF